MSKMQRTKGAVGEREAAALLLELFPNARRRVTGEEARRVKLGADLSGTGPFCVQVKYAGAVRPLAALAEAAGAGAAAAGDIPIAMVRQIRMGKSTGWAVVMSAADFLAMARRAGYGEAPVEAPPATG